MSKRDWSKYPARLIKSYSGLSGVGLGISGFVLTVGALIPGVNIAEMIILGLGAGVGGISILGGAISAIPEEFREATKLVGKYETLANLADINPPLYRIGIVGISQSGKSTLVKSFARIHPNKRKEGKTEGRTNELYIYIHGLFIPELNDTTGNFAKYLGIIDGDGGAFNQQFKIAEESDFLCIVLDHNSIGKESRKSKNIAQINNDRLTKHDEFLNQIYVHLKNTRANKPLSHIHFLLNKKDFWQKNDSSSSNELGIWFNKHIQEWKSNAHFIKKVTFDYHSNQQVEDIEKLEHRILESINGQND